jgi:hypothetical protein
MARIQRLFLYDEGDPSVRDLVALSGVQLVALVEYIDQHGFQFVLKDISDLAATLGLSYEKTADLVSYTGFLEGERVRLGFTAEDMIAEFETFLERHRESGLKDNLSKISSSLVRLFVDRPKIALRVKSTAVSAGIVPQAIDFHSLCDLRPVFDEGRDVALNYVSVALVRVLVRNDSQQDSSLIFQIDEDGLNRLTDFVERLKKKMGYLENVKKQILETKK